MTELQQLQALAGIRPANNNAVDFGAGSNVSLTASEKRQLEREHNIRPGTDAWMKLWFSRPYLTGEKPI